MMTYQRLKRDPTSTLQRKNNDLVEELFKNLVISSTEKNRLKTDAATSPRIYGLPKIHKEGYPLRPICSSVNAPSSQLCKYITNILKKITANSPYNVRDSVQFRDKIKNLTIKDDERLCSFDVVSLFPSIPVDLALKIIEDRWNEITIHTDMSKSLFLNILKFCIKDNRYFKYDGKIYAQKKGLPMGSPASPIVADIVMEKLLDTCIGNLTKKPKILTKYVDDLFSIVPECEIELIMNGLNSFHRNIKFTMEKEIDSRLPYLDTLVIRDNNRLKIDWFQKPTASGRIINFFSKHPKRVIVNTANNLIKRVLNISDDEFHRKNKEKIKHILRNNSFPTKFAKKLIRNFEKLNPTYIISTETPSIYKALTYVPKISERLEKSKLFDAEKYKMAHKTTHNLGKLYSNTKDRIDKWEESNVIYKIPCNGKENEICKKVYIGTTKNKLKSRIAAHKSDQKIRNISTQKTALTAHCANTHHSPNLDDVQILQREENYKRRYMLEMLNIIKIPTTARMNFKADVEGSSAQQFRYLVNKERQ